VLPCAIERDIWICGLACADTTVEVSNTDPGYPDLTFSLESIKAGPPGDWGNYIKAGVQRFVTSSNQIGWSGVVDGTIPYAAGLSSSSALVVASALTFLGVTGQRWPATDLAQELALAEQFVGTAGGGMDQTISLLAQQDHALKIDFTPPSHEPIPLLGDYKLAICYSGIRAPKSKTARLAYNRRAIECRLAARILRQMWQNQQGPIEASRLADLDRRYWPGDPRDFKRMTDTLKQLDHMDLREIAERLSCSSRDLIEHELQTPSGVPLSEPAGGFRIGPRYQHVVEEAERVEQAARALRMQNADDLGRLMNASHESCRTLYEISTPELDALVQAARQNGAIGARLTGAGFGGCVVALVHQREADRFLKGIWTDYYETTLPRQHPDWAMDSTLYNNAENVLFFTQAASAAGWLRRQDWPPELA
jgi:N-acetylgalactosamine kinase